MMKLFVRVAYPAGWLMLSHRLGALLLFVALGGAVVGGVAGAYDIGWLGGSLICAICGFLFELVGSGSVRPIMVQIANALWGSSVTFFLGVKLIAFFMQRSIVRKLMAHNHRTS